MLANLLDSLALPAGSRIAVQTEKSVEALMLYLAVLRAGLVYLPLNSAYQSAEIEYFIGNAEPAVVVCTPRNFGWVSKLAFKAGTAHVFTLDDDRGGSLLQRAALHSDRHTPALRGAGRPGRDPLHQRHDRAQQGRDAEPRQPAVSNARGAEGLLGLARPGDVLIHALPIFHVHGLFVAIARRAAERQQDDLVRQVRAAHGDRPLPEATVFMGVPTLLCAAARRGRADARGLRRHMRLFISGSAPLLIETFNDFASAPATPSSSATA